MHWAAKDILYWLIALLPLAVILRLMLRWRERRLQMLADQAALDRLLPERQQTIHRRRLFCTLAATALIGIALARPQWGASHREVRHEGLEIIVVLDTSNSMRAEDFRPNRLQAAKWGIRDLVEHLDRDRIGLVAFAGDSFLISPLTIDYGAFMMALDDVHPGIIARGGTEIDQALRLAMDSFDHEAESDKVIILVSDGEDHGAPASRLIPKMRDLDITLFAIGVGSPDGGLIPISDRDGSVNFLRDRQGNVVRTRLDERTLQELALGTGGIYVRASAGDFGFERIIDQGIDRLKRDQLESRLIVQYEERFAVFIGAALLMLIVESLLGVAKGVKRPEREARI